MSSLAIPLGIIIGALLFFAFLIPVWYRRVVSTNEVHIIQSSKSTVSYGKDTENGNSYYAWPSWIPIVGVSVIRLPVSVFDLTLNSYEAYDKGRLPFVIDIKAFFRISDSNVAASRIASFDELREQLEAIVQGSCRTILASHDIEEIMQGRSQFGDSFTKEVTCQLKAWGVETVKNIELMDIRDAKESKVIHNIMAKKKSLIDMESRQEVAKNQKAAEIAEIEAKREIELQKQEAQQQVGLRTVEAAQKVDIAKQTALQTVKEQEKTTKQKEMDVISVANTRQAAIDKEVAIIQANRDRETAVIAAGKDKETAVIGAQKTKETAIIVADGKLDATQKEADALLAMKKREAEGAQLVGEAKAAAEKAMLLAPVDSQIKLAQEIGSNKEYQQYLITIEQIKANQAVGVEQAKAMEKANIKVISTAGTPSEGIKSVGELFTPKGGTQLGTMLEAFANTDTGKAILSTILPTS